MRRIDPPGFAFKISLWSLRQQEGRGIRKEVRERKGGETDLRSVEGELGLEEALRNQAAILNLRFCISTEVTYQAFCISEFTLQLITVAGTVLNGRSIREVEKHWMRRMSRAPR